MSVLPIRTFGEPVLRQRAPEVIKVTEAQRRLAADMLDTMRVAPGVGLAAPQVGVLERIFVFEVEDCSGAVINPVIVERSPDTLTEDEACLSIPGLAFPVERHARVRVEALDESGEPVVLEGEGLLARVFQHEIDHLDGVLFIDRLADENRREAMTQLREQALGLSPPRPAAEVRPEGRL
ncbi:MAG: peptide deformylase [Actinomycetota bacterium]